MHGLAFTALCADGAGTRPRKAFGKLLQTVRVNGEVEYTHGQAVA
ncbi:hypothetical protein N8I74_17710 [Chitiniphilus purpureus]|uniref:Uncharacterized protein n=1 Tax=Chitiniphilus purpureus TaxID=2981137 RepID=A0ABY6DL90_9NEIS|nr:hypothetical protein [Chitiniphilus sp. CD1]UXY15127.1 hypothetical protein N8I74_17710 [Chitiniphilus sp. CD1]